MVLRALSKCLLNTDRLGASTTSLGSLFQCLTSLTQKYFGQNEAVEEDIHEDRLAERKKFDSVNHLHTGTTWIDLRSLIPTHTSSLGNRASLHPHAICVGLSYVQVRAGCSQDLAMGTA